MHLFTRFYRVDKSRSRNAGGGPVIGLTIIHYLVEAHGSSFSFGLKARDMFVTFLANLIQLGGTNLFLERMK